MSSYRKGQQISVSASELLALQQALENQFQDKRITFNDTPNVLVTTALQQLLELAAGKANIVVADELPDPTTANTQYWVKTYNGETKETGRFIILTDNINTATYIGESEVDLSDYLKFENIQTALSGDYFYAFTKDDTTYYTKQIEDSEGVDVYAITKTEGYVSAITKQGTQGTLANGVLTFSTVEYTHAILLDGFYVVGEDKKVVGVSALKDVMDKAGKVNDVKLGGKSIVDSKVANIETIDNLESNFYYAFKNGTTYRYTKSKAVGTTACYQFTYTDNVLTKIENIGNITIYLNENGIPELAIGTTRYIYDKTKDDYYIIDPEYKVPSIKAETQDFTQTELNRIFEDLYQTPNLQIVRYGEDVYTATNLSSGIASSVDYDSAIKTQGVRIGKTACVMFHKKLNVTSAITNNWITIGTIKPAFRPKYSVPIVVGIYGMSSQSASVAGNYAAGGHIQSDGLIRVWTTLATGNNMQIRVQTSMYELSDAALAAVI